VDPRAGMDVWRWENHRPVFELQSVQNVA
jgi:hypothetical protein